MPLFNIIIGVIVSGALLWLVFVVVVVHLQPSDPGEAILVDEGVAPTGYSIVYVTDDEGGQGDYDSLSKRRVQFEDEKGRRERHPLTNPISR